MLRVLNPEISELAVVDASLPSREKVQSTVGVSVMLCEEYYASQGMESKFMHTFVEWKWCAPAPICPR